MFGKLVSCGKQTEEKDTGTSHLVASEYRQITRDDKPVAAPSARPHNSYFLRGGSRGIAGRMQRSRAYGTRSF